MAGTVDWLIESESAKNPAAGGILAVDSYSRSDLLPEEVVVMEKAVHYRADAVLFETRRDGQPAVPQAFIYKAKGNESEHDFAELHRRLWSWGGVPIVYRVTIGKIEMFRCAHKPDFQSKKGPTYNPFDEYPLGLLIEINASPWWKEDALRNGTLWDDPEVCDQLLAERKSAHRTLINVVRDLYQDVSKNSKLKGTLPRRLLILSILIAYLEERKVFENDFWATFLAGSENFFEVLANGPALVSLLDHLESRFNGQVFALSDEDRRSLSESKALAKLADLIEGKQEINRQRTLWKLYSFADLPVELISQIYQLFVDDPSVAVYTPQFIVRLILGEILDMKRMDRLEERNEVILDGACGSGIFLVEAYKRLVLHWRVRNGWKRPTQSILKRLLTDRIRGIDVDRGAVELAAFSLCLALCDALEPEEIRTSVRLFPELKGKTLLHSCFFKSIQQKLIRSKIGALVGNPPFTSELKTAGEQLAYDEYQSKVGPLPDKQVAYLFLHESMNLLERGGVLSMIQQYNFLYNEQSAEFRKQFFSVWNVREVLDFISIDGLFKRSGKNTKVIVVVAEADPPDASRQILHATFRASNRTSAGQGFDLDYYDIHWFARDKALRNDLIWRSSLFGGGRVLDFANRLGEMRTLGDYAANNDWDFGEGFILGSKGTTEASAHIVGKKYLPSVGLGPNGIDIEAIGVAPEEPIERPRTKRRFTPPILLIREQMDLYHDLWTGHYLTYPDQIVGLSSNSKDDMKELTLLNEWIDSQLIPLRAYVAVTSTRLFTKKASSISRKDISKLPFPETLDLDLSEHERIVVKDVVDFYRDLILKGEDSATMKEPGSPALKEFNLLFTGRINSVYREKKLRGLKHFESSGVICQPFVFGNAEAYWTNSEELKDRVDLLLRERQGGGLNITRIARIYDGAYIYFIKPNRLRYWLKSIALRDSDEVLADLAQQGF